MRHPMQLVVFILAALLAYPVHAQIPALVEVPDTVLDPERTTLQQARRALYTRLSGLQQRGQVFNAACANIEKGSATEQSCRQKQVELSSLRSAYIDDAEAFNARVRGVKTTDLEIEIERKRFREAHNEWLKEKEQIVRAAVAAGADWTKDVLLALRYGRPAQTEGRPESLKDLKPGDILLVAPPINSGAGAAFSRLVAIADQFYTGRIFTTGQTASPASHALTFIGRTADGRMLFLDHTSKRGSHIIGETEFRQEYVQRTMFVAKPQTVVNGRELLQAALDAAKDAGSPHIPGSNFGVLGKNDAVCSERAALVVARASGKDEIYKDNRRLGPVDITPADFFDNKHIGKYFVISAITDVGKAGTK